MRAAQKALIPSARAPELDHARTICFNDPMARITIERVYAPSDIKSAKRVLIDRLWPRGIKKEALEHDIWLKEIAPTNELRKWYGHDRDRYEEFKRRYLKELGSGAQAEALERLEELGEKRLILLTATKDVDHSSASVLFELLESKAKESSN